MRVFKAPQSLRDVRGYSLFLGGSIEMGTAEDWQTYVAKELGGLPITLLNPRRDEWDSSWIQDISNPQFREQVEWELDALELADHIFMYFQPGTKSPITLLEFGLYAKSDKLTVVCAEGFWRKGNVDIVCNRYRVERVMSVERFVQRIKGQPW